MRHPRRLLLIALLAAIALVAAACSSTEDTTTTAGTPETTTATTQPATDEPTTTEAVTPDEPVAAACDTSGIDAVYAALEGLDAEARRAALIDLSVEEDEGILFYTSLNLDDSLPVIEGFEDLTDLDVDLYRASSSTVLQRTVLEADANFEGGADVVLINGPEMAVLDDLGLLLPLNSPITDDIVPAAVFPTWAGVYMNVFTPAWNTDALGDEELPTTWQEVFENFEGRLAMELGDFDWFATLVKDYFVADLGMTEDAAVDLFRNAAANTSKVIDGHTLMVQLLIAGEFDIVSSAYHHRVVRESGKGAPINWEPAVEPLVIRPNGIGLHCSTKAPGTALLYAEYMMTDAQPFLVEGGRTPANQTVEGGIDQSLFILGVDVVTLNEEREKWETLYEQIVSGIDVVE